MTGMKIGDEVYIHGFVDEIRNGTVIIRNAGGYFGTVKEEVRDGVDAVGVVRCKDCVHRVRREGTLGVICDMDDSRWAENDYCSYGERRSDG